MEVIIFCGLQASGKTTFYQQHFINSHLRLSLDLLHTRNKEIQFMLTCFATQQPFVIDNTNATRQDRRKYIEWCRAYQYKVIGYYFQIPISLALERNKGRTGKACIPEKGIWATFHKLEVPCFEEGFDRLFTVTNSTENFLVTEML